MLYSKRVISAFAILSFFLLSLGGIANAKLLLKQNNFLTETELEEVLEFEELNESVENQIQNKLKLGGNSQACYFEKKENLFIPFFSNDEEPLNSFKQSTYHHPFFILYCCLKLDC